MCFQKVGTKQFQSDFKEHSSLPRVKSYFLVAPSEFNANHPGPALVFWSGCFCLGPRRSRVGTPSLGTRALPLRVWLFTVPQLSRQRNGQKLAQRSANSGPQAKYRPLPRRSCVFKGLVEKNQKDSTRVPAVAQRVENPT